MPLSIQAVKAVLFPFFLLVVVVIWILLVGRILEQWVNVCSECCAYLDYVWDSSMMNAAIPQICVDPATLTPLICQGDHGSVSPDTATHSAVMYRTLNATTCLSIIYSFIRHTPLVLVGVHAAAFMKHCHPLSPHLLCVCFILLQRVSMWHWRMWIIQVVSIRKKSHWIKFQ